MPCCGNMRQVIATASPTSLEPGRGPGDRPQPRFTIAFEYTGQTGLTVVGAVSRRRYRFDGSGARVVVDPRDRPSLLKVPKLRFVTA